MLRFRRKPPIMQNGDAGPVAVLDVPPPPAPPPAPALVGYLEERSTRHVSGWVRNPDALDESVEFEVVCTLPGAERTIARGRANLYIRIQELSGVGNAAYGFWLVFPEAISEAERDHLEVRPVVTGEPLPHAPNLRTRWEPIRFVNMDIVDNCNLRCPFCVYDYSNVHTTNVMTDEVFEKTLTLLPLVGVEQFWLSCLHEPTMHPKLTEFIRRIPREYRGNVFYTTNLARRMRPEYYETLADSGIDHLNISIESRDPAIYERMRKGARHRIFMECWDQLLCAFAQGSAPPRLHYVILAYKSNLREIPGLVEYLLNERRAASLEVRHTFDQSHIPAEFKAVEYLEADDWKWLRDELAGYPAGQVILTLPPELLPRTPLPVAPESRSTRLEGAFWVRVSYDGLMHIAPALADLALDRPELARFANIKDIGDPAEFFATL